MSPRPKTPKACGAPLSSSFLPSPSASLKRACTGAKCVRGRKTVGPMSSSTSCSARKPVSTAGSSKPSL
eukprot:scaffold70187_cov60-Phaeocystis_antarctica.AAC.2